MMHARIFHPRKKLRRTAIRPPQLRHSWTGNPVATFVVAYAASHSKPAVTSRGRKRAPTAMQDKLHLQSERNFALCIAEAHASLSTCGTLPHLRISITWLTTMIVRTLHAHSSRHRELVPGLASASLFSLRHRFSGHVGRQCYLPLCESTYPLPSGPQFPVVIQTTDFPVRRYKIPVSAHAKISQCSSVS